MSAIILAGSKEAAISAWLVKCDPSRKLLRHSVNVRQTAEKCNASLGLGLNPGLVGTTGMTHDCAKYLSLSEVLNLAIKSGVQLLPIDFYCNGEFFVDSRHADAGVECAKEQLDIFDPDALGAIRSHTHGNNDMTTLDLLTMFADDVEPDRDKDTIGLILKALEEGRTENRLERTVLKTFDIKLKKAIKKNYRLHPQKIDSRNYLLYKLNGENIDKVTLDMQFISDKMSQGLSILEILNKQLKDAIKEGKMIDPLLVEFWNNSISKSLDKK